MDTRDSQQVKVYLKIGEYLNVGSSHVGIEGGFIQVYRPDGTLAAVYDGSGTNPNEAIIFNNIQEMTGPTGGVGYDPGVIEAGAGEEGIWTVRFDYPDADLGTFTNIPNGAAWTRAANQPVSQRVILAWDVTVSQNAAGDQGGDLLTGRVYSNKYVSVLLGNGVTTSPTFYIDR